jgi:predicted amidohydrolase YtcJ
MLIKNAQLYGNDSIDLRCQQGLIVEIACSLQGRDKEPVFDARGGAVLPGLHDHHLHLYSLAASHASVFCGPPQVVNAEQLAAVLRKDNGDGWVRGVGYHDSVAGELTRWQLDKYLSDRPVRIQHRSGKMWILNSLAVQLLELDKCPDLEGIERDKKGQANGRLFRLDDWLRKQLGVQSLPDIAPVSKLLASYGVSGISDATPTNSRAMVSQLTTAIEQKKLLQRVTLLGDSELPVPEHPWLQRGAVKILLDEHKLPEFDELTVRIQSAHQAQRAVAIHCVTRTELIFALSALLAAGKYPGDRIEHASVTEDAAFALMLESGITVVTQPGFIATRGDQYLADVKEDYHSLLYRCRSFLQQGIPLAGSSDAPYGDADPWLTMRAAVQRCTASGKVIAGQERLTPEQALALFTAPADNPGGPSRKIAVGEIADLCLLDRSWDEARVRLRQEDVAATIRAGELIYQR